MKTQLLAAAAALTNLISQLPDEAPVAALAAPATPTGLSIVADYGDNPRSVELAWDDLEAGCSPILEYRGAEGSPAGPQEWTPIPVNGMRGPHGEFATLTIQNPGGQSLEISLRAHRASDNASSERARLTIDPPQ